jgi:hypothetical protein
VPETANIKEGITELDNMMNSKTIFLANRILNKNKVVKIDRRGPHVPLLRQIYI